MSYSFHVFETSAIDGCGMFHAPLAPYPGKEPHGVEVWVDPRAGLDTVSKRRKSLPPPGMEPQSYDPKFGHRS